MSFITMKMAETFPEGDILEELDTLEEQTIAGFAGLVYTACLQCIWLLGRI